MAIKIEMLRTFRAVVSHGSLSAAAQALGRTPSAVSMMLKQFEDHLGSPLFEGSRKAQLTALGRAVDAEARREIDHFDRTLAAIHGLARADRGHVRLAVTPSLGQTLAPRALGRFLSAHPEVRVELRDMTTPEVHGALSDDRADIGLASAGPVPGCEGQVLLADAFGVVCRADHPLARDWDRLTWADLDGRDLIENGLCDQIRDPAFVHLRADARLNAPNTASLLGLVREGLGITVLPRMVMPEGDASLVFLPLVDTEARRDIWLLHQPVSTLTPAARALVAEFLIFQEC